MRNTLVWMLVAALLCMHASGVRAQETSAVASMVGSGTPISCSEAALSAAIAAGGMITFDCGGPHTFVLSTPQRVDKAVHIDGGGMITFTVNSNDTLRGAAGDRSTSVANFRLFDVDVNASLTLENSTLTGARSSGSDGGAIANDGTLVVRNVRFIDNQTDGEHSGGAIFSAGPLHVSHSYFERNGASWGTAIAAERMRAQVVITDSVFVSGTYNSPINLHGGAIYVGARASLDVRGGRFAGNRAGSGGALYIGADAHARLGPSPQGNAPLIISNNHADFGGGGIWNSGELVIAGARITANSVYTGSTIFGYGGGIANWLGVLTMTRTLLRDNIANSGGGLFTGYAQVLSHAHKRAAPTVSHAASLAHAELNQVRITGNIALSGGGGVYAANDSPDLAFVTLAITDSVVRDNMAKAAGGGVYVSNGQAVLARSTLVFNEAGRGGGAALDGRAASVLRISDSTISNNTLTQNGVQGGGIYNMAAVELRNVTLTDNSNGLFSNAGTITLTGVVLENPGFLNCDTGVNTQLVVAFSVGTDDSCGAGFPKSGDTAGLGPLHEDMSGQLARIPLPDSRLIDAGGPDCARLDQRQNLRADRCDIGAIEYDGLFLHVRLPLVTR